MIEAIAKAADERLRLYPDPACTEFREAVAARYGVAVEQVFAGNGSDEVLAFAFAAFFECQGVSGAVPILFPDITYSFYPVYARLWDVPFRTVSLKDNFSIDPDDYKQNNGGIIFPNPNAPTAKALALDAITKLAGYEEKNGKALIVDEAYIAFADKPGIKSAVTLVKQFPNLLTVHTLSKAASLAGLRVGFAIGHKDLIEALCRVRDSVNSYTVDRLALAGAAAAVSDFAYYDEVNRHVCSTREKVSASLAQMGFTVIPSQANFVFASPPASSGKSGMQVFSALREKGILVRRFDKPRINNYLRISMGTDDEMDTFLNGCAEIIRG
ncbi:histidinol-phosphate transaminase [Leadbettera azotonutricia ZAS-9]|uniref:Histidinol-phosphate transaminase n=1 Tax=Leadbettera azotonutricia (strain ATCC BAA-888 / DSM 13862 / ZAS-9) TaxID=545695 RepID=F5Y984_LEAAZ|nr:histidinol-phosphate transaminase [Leadbettera azotonutricia ZAS-9]